MLESYPLITTIVASVVFAFSLGFLANRLHLPTIVGYLLAGIMLGPYTPGFVADIGLAKQLAEIGVILLMFGVGLHFSVRDLVAVRRIALNGALIQTSITTFIGFILVYYLKYDFLESLVFGLGLSVASTVVLLRAFEDYRVINSNVGKIAVGWLVAEDIIMIVVLILLPILAQSMHSGEYLDAHVVFKSVFLVFIKISIFVIAMTVIGRKLLPRLLIAIAKTKSRELMSLGSLAIACGFAFVAYSLFGASFALGAFIAGLILNESEIGKKSAERSLPLRDIFAVLFFISAGMLFDPKIVLREPVLVLISFLLVTFIKPLVAFLVMKFFKQSKHDSLFVALGLAQIGEFSFILAALALKLNIFVPTLYDIVIASAFLSIIINPFLFRIVKNRPRS